MNTETENQPKDTPEEQQTPPLYLADEPARIAEYLKSKSTEDSPAKFADFITDITMTDFDDVYQIRAILESQAHMLAATFQYLVVEGDAKSLAFALRAQKMMRDTITEMNGYPSLSYRQAMQKIPLTEDKPST